MATVMPSHSDLPVNEPLAAKPLRHCECGAVLLVGAWCGICGRRHSDLPVSGTGTMSEQEQGWTKKSASPYQQQEPEPSRDARAWPYWPNGAAEFHRDRAENASPFWPCRACGILRREHGTDGQRRHWFVPPKSMVHA